MLVLPMHLLSVTVLGCSGSKMSKGQLTIPGGHNLRAPPSQVCVQCHRTIHLMCMHCGGCGFCVPTLECLDCGRAHPNENKSLFQKWCLVVDVLEGLTATPPKQSEVDFVELTTNWSFIQTLFWPLHWVRRGRRKRFGDLIKKRWTSLHFILWTLRQLEVGYWGRRGREEMLPWHLL